MASHFDSLSSESLAHGYLPSFSQTQRWDNGIDSLSSESDPHGYPPSFNQTQHWDNGIIHGLARAGASLTSSAGYSSRDDDLEISQISQLAEQDSDIMPIAELPKAFYKFNTTRTPELCAPDPDLWLTPDKRAHIPRSNLKNDTEAKDKLGRKVRFDVESSSESEFDKSPEKGIVTLLDQNSTRELPARIVVEKHVSSVVDDSSNVPKNVEISTQNHAKFYPYSIQQKTDNARLKQTHLNDIETVFKHNKAVNVTTGQHNKTKGNNPGESVSMVTREQEERPPVVEYNFPFTEDTKTLQETGLLLSSAFERPEYNSTLRLGQELKQLTLTKPDVAKAVQETLEKSDTLKTDINEKAASKVNKNGPVFPGLASIEVHANDFISQVERSHMSKVKPVSNKNKQDSKPKEPSIKEPDLMEFFTDDLQREEVDLSVSGIYFPKELLSTASHDKAFDLYRHNLAWDPFD